MQSEDIAKLTSILLSNTEIPMDVYMNVLLEYIMTALLEYKMTALLEYIDLLNKFFKRAHVPPAHPSLKDESKLMLHLCCIFTISCSLQPN